MTIFIINILIIFGIHVLFSERMLLSGVREWLIARRSQKLFKMGYFELSGIQQQKVKFPLKPFILCPPCMGSFWGIVGFIFTDYSWWYLPVWCIALSGAVYLLIQFMPE